MFYRLKSRKDTAKKTFGIRFFSFLLISTLSCQTTIANDSAWQKPRVFVLSDIENEPDDAQSLVRFLVYSNQWDVEGIVATTSVHQKNRTAAARVRRIIEAYGKVQKNLAKHEKGFPEAKDLLAVVSEGKALYGMSAVGKGMDSRGSEALIAAVDKKDTRPLWVTVWGGPNVLAQALWKVNETRSKEELKTFIEKLRVYTISDQDDSGPWIRQNFPSLHYIASPGFHSGGGYHFATWSGISGDNFHARFTGADFEIVDNPWLDRNIRRKGPLGAEHPRTEYLLEGDTPSFLGLINNGLNSPENPHWGGWGGRYEYYTPRMQKHMLEAETRPFWSNAQDEVLGTDGKWHTSNHATIWRWRNAFQNDFSARMDWTIKEFQDANHPPVVLLGHPRMLNAKAGERVELVAKNCSDPDGDSLSYNWFYYQEPGTFTTASARSGQAVKVNNFDQAKAWFEVPTKRVLRKGSMHFILAVTDHGKPRLTRYERVIVNVAQ
ncbi:Protein of unknown function [Alteromonadaceae bacterium Bs31]|nr:Protein of unknown function [Alteromonadaceae bacterium Bs31]